MTLCGASMKSVVMGAADSFRVVASMIVPFVTSFPARPCARTGKQCEVDDCKAGSVVGIVE